MSETEDRDSTEALDYLLGELGDADRAAFESRLAADPTLRERVSDAEEVVLALRELPPDGWEAADPPPLAPLPNGAVTTTPPEFVLPEAPTEPPARRSAPPMAWWRRGPAIAAGALGVLLAGLAVGAALNDGDGGSTSSGEGIQELSRSELRPASLAGRGAEGSAVLLSGVGNEETLQVSVEGMPPTAPGRYYELWFMSGRKLVSLGGFRVGVDGRRRVTVPLPVDPADFRLVDISLERADDGPGHSATSMLRGPV